jgi:transcriptional regulator of arginine metabolism
MNMHNARDFMHALTDHQQADRREAIMRILRGVAVRNQQHLVSLLKKEGHEVTQSSVSRDLRDLGVLKAAGGYVLPPEDTQRTNGDFRALGQFVRGVKHAGPCITVVRTTIGAAQSVAVAIDKAEWPEVVGTISGDDTIFIATTGSSAQAKLNERLRTIFRV